MVVWSVWLSVWGHSECSIMAAVLIPGVQGRRGESNGRNVSSVVAGRCIRALQRGGNIYEWRD